MKRFLLKSVLVISVLTIIIVILNQFIMRNIKTEVVINASVEEVWNVLMDHQSYPKWNPFIKQISGSTQPGNYLQVMLQSEGNKPMQFKPIVLSNSLNNEFRWKGKLFIKGLFDGEHYFLLEKIDDNHTKFIQGENFTGLLSGLLFKMIGKDTEDGFNAMNLALKNVVEELPN